VGRHIVLAEPEPDLASSAGISLLRHEAVHAVQQNLAEPMQWNDLAVDPVPALEQEAARFESGACATSVLGTLNRCAIQRHVADPCLHVPPRWVEMTGLRREVWLPANQVIEAAYLATHPSHTVLLGSQFEGWRDIRLPRGAQDEAFNNEILNQLRGLQHQRAPDIVDFTDHVFYEIKTPAYAAEGREQLRSLYHLVDTIRIQYGGPHWNPDLATWYPPHHMPLPADVTKLVCTADTEHDQSPAGLLLYRVFRRLGAKEEQEVVKHTVAIEEIEPEIRDMREPILTELRRVVNDYERSTELWIVAARDIFRVLVLEPQMERTIDKMRVHAMDPRRNPVIGFRNLGWTLVGITAATMAVVMTGTLIAGTAAAAAPAGAAAAGAGTAGTAAAEATVISLNAVRAARAAAQAAQLDKAAGILLVLGVVDANTAHANPAVRTLSPLRALPVSEFPETTYQLRRQVSYNGEAYYIVGRAIVG
jgi:hypothetical protein